MLLLAVLCLLPVLWALRGTASVRGRRDSALALHRAQLTELDRDLAEGRLPAAEHDRARLEVQRRLLLEAGREEGAPPRASRRPVLLAAVLVPLCALALYLTGGRPDLPGAPLAARRAAAAGGAARDDELIGELRRQVASLDPHSDQALQGWRILGQAEAARGRWAEAAQAWRHSLDARFDPTIAAEAAEAATRAEGHVSPASVALFRRALEAGPADAPWHALAVDRLAQASHGG